MPYSRRTFLRSAAFFTGIAGVLTLSGCVALPHHAPPPPKPRPAAKAQTRRPRHSSSSSAAAAPPSMASINVQKSAMR